MRKNILLFTILYFCAACSSDEENGGNGDGGNNNGNSDFTITLENSDFDGEAVIMYTDNSTATATFENGELGLISSSAGNKTIKSLTIGDYEPILIGRLEGEDISLNYNDGILDFRTAQGGPIPVGTFAEFQLIRKNNTSLGGSYAMESNLDLMEIEWIPIGNSSTGGSFRGTFDGNNFEIKNLKSSSEGLFGTASAESNTTFTEIKNLVIRSGIIQGCTIASIADIVSNCSNYATVTLGSLNQGSLVGIIVKRIENCTNFGNINCNYNSDSVGGIVGGVSNRKGELLISNCHNNGHITVNVDYGGRIGGIIGSTYNSYIYPSNPITISGCINTGNISCNKVEYLGGILGYGLARPNITVSDCENRGAITVSQFSAYVGGVIGFGMTIRDCHNYGDIQVSGEAMMVGGLGGIVAAMISNCHNEGSLSATGQIGGIGGIAAGLGNIAADTMQTTINGSCLSSYNKGSITLTLNNSATARVGGVIGNLSPGVVAYCYNQGNLNCQMSYGRIGGVVGSFSLGSGLSNCYNTGRIDGANNVENLLFIGGIVGSGWATSTANNYWKDFADDVAFTGAGLWGFNSQDPNTTYPLDTGSSIFSATHWPSASDGWNLGTGAGSGYWQSLGSWNNGDPAYPKLWFE